MVVAVVELSDFLAQIHRYQPPAYLILSEHGKMAHSLLLLNHHTQINQTDFKHSDADTQFYVGPISNHILDKAYCNTLHVYMNCTFSSAIP